MNENQKLTVADESQMKPEGIDESSGCRFCHMIQEAADPFKAINQYTLQSELIVEDAKKRLRSGLPILYV